MILGYTRTSRPAARSSSPNSFPILSLLSIAPRGSCGSCPTLRSSLVSVSTPRRPIPPLKIDRSAYTMGRRLSWREHGFLLLGTKSGTGGALALQFLRDYAAGARLIRILTKMKHPATLGLIGWAEDTDYRILMMELIPNGSLDGIARLVHEGRPPLWRDTTAQSKAVLGIVSGMAFVHSLGLLHGSLDPIHILLDAAYDVRIAVVRHQRFSTCCHSITGGSCHRNIGLIEKSALALCNIALLRSMYMLSRSPFICCGRPSHSSLSGV
jgi:serine/threonine protein kinase